MTNSSNLHGVFMNIFGLGTLITGDSGIGKSELALQLINKGHQLIADDAPIFHKTTANTLVGASSEVLQDFLEVKGLGVLNIRNLFGEQAIIKTRELKFIIHLKKTFPSLQNYNFLKGSYRTATLCGVDIPEIELLVENNRDLLTLSEVAVRQQQLKIQGYDAFNDLENRQRKAMI